MNVLAESATAVAKEWLLELPVSKAMGLSRRAPDRPGRRVGYHSQSASIQFAAFLKENKISRKRGGQTVSNMQNPELRAGWTSLYAGCERQALLSRRRFRKGWMSAEWVFCATLLHESGFRAEFPGLVSLNFSIYDLFSPS